MAEISATQFSFLFGTGQSATSLIQIDPGKHTFRNSASFLQGVCTLEYMPVILSISSHFLNSIQCLVTVMRQSLLLDSTEFINIFYVNFLFQRVNILHLIQMTKVFFF